MNSTQGRLRAVHLMTILVVGGLVAMVTSSCGSNADTETPPVEEAGAGQLPDGAVAPDAEQPDTGHFLDAGPCVPQPIDCTNKCGPIRDACSGEVKLCGGCPTGEVCDLQLHTCGTPKTKCSDFGAQCGQVKTSCGKYISCGSCPSGQECNPDTNKCQASQPVTCQDLGYECGAAWLGIGDPAIKTNCGTCKDPNKNRCNAAFNTCELSCTPTWKVVGLTGPQITAAKKAFCDAARQNKGVQCGTISDGCGSTIDCSLSQGFSCPAGQGCGVRGVANRCEPFPTPPECETLGKNCGTLVSACDGKTISCGVCGGAGEVCNDNGVCGPPCTSKTCAQALPSGQACGTASDGCKGTLNCTCPSAGKCVGGTCCQPKVCSQLVFSAGQCGRKLPDGCGGTVNCNCASGTCPAADGTTASCCLPRTCAANYAGQCGSNLDDGCGGTIDCGCGGGGSTCIVGGPPGSAAPSGTPGSCCTETNCAANSCNTTVASVCISGQNITCNTCPPNQVCNGTSCCMPSGSCGGQCGITIDPGCGLPLVACGCNLPFTCNASNVCICDPYTCASPQFAGMCGSFDNGCLGVINCNPCVGGQVCNNQTQACCTPKTCAADYPGQCGRFTNGCGGTVDCNPCVGGQVCNNGTQTCCTPKSCGADFPGQCGQFADGCGGTVDCNPCVGGQVCNNGTQTCCTPKSCGTDFPGQCGTFADGCGNNLGCACGGTQVCSANTCCTPLKCSAAQYVGKCGTFSDACGGNINCGCTLPNTCGGGGTAGACGCTPKKAPADCAGQVGTFADGCGSTFTCTG